MLRHRMYATTLVDRFGELYGDDSTPQRVLADVALESRCSIERLKSRERSEPLVAARQAAYYLLRERCALSYEQIAQMMDNRDHATIMYGVQQIRDAMESRRRTETARAYAPSIEQ